MLLPLFLYIAWAVELSGLTRTMSGMFWPNWLHLALVMVLWHRSGVGAVAWGAVIGLLLDLQAGIVGVHLLLVSTLSLAATDWRDSDEDRSGAELALMAALVLAIVLMSNQMWNRMSSGTWPAAHQLAAGIIGPAAAAVLPVLVLRWSMDLSRYVLKGVVTPGAVYEG